MYNNIQNNLFFIVLLISGIYSNQIHTKKFLSASLQAQITTSKDGDLLKNGEDKCAWFSLKSIEVRPCENESAFIWNFSQNGDKLEINHGNGVALGVDAYSNKEEFLKIEMAEEYNFFYKWTIEWVDSKQFLLKNDNAPFCVGQGANDGPNPSLKQVPCDSQDPKQLWRAKNPGASIFSDIRGVLRDATTNEKLSEDVVPSAKVTFTNDATGEVIDATINPPYPSYMADVPNGSWTVTGSASGYNDAVSKAKIFDGDLYVDLVFNPIS